MLAGALLMRSWLLAEVLGDEAGSSHTSTVASAFFGPWLPDHENLVGFCCASGGAELLSEFGL